MRQRLAAFAIVAGLEVAGLGASGGAAGQDAAPLMTTGDLVRLCDESSDVGSELRVAQCNGFIAGTGLLYLKLQRAGVIGQWVCAPERTGLAEARAAFVTWAQANPTLRDEDVTDGFWRAMASRWPCDR